MHKITTWVSSMHATRRVTQPHSYETATGRQPSASTRRLLDSIGVSGIREALTITFNVKRLYFEQFEMPSC